MRTRLLPMMVVAIMISGFAPQEPSEPVGVEPPVAQAPRGEVLPNAGTEEAPATGSVASGLPRRAPEPRTMRAQWPVFALLAVSWIGIVAYLLVIGRRSRRIAALVDGTGRVS